MMQFTEKTGWQRALWRYAALSQVEALILSGSTLAQAIIKISKNTFLYRDGRYKGVSQRSLRRWYKAYKDGGVAALTDAPRNHQIRALTPQFLSFLKREKEYDHDASIPEIIERAVERRIIGERGDVNRTTVYRAARSLNLPILRRPTNEATTMRPFAYEHRMMMVLCDGKHFRAGADAKKRVALIFIDDATRKVLDATSGPSETTALFLKSLYRVLSRYGRFGALYLDNGSGFKSDDVATILASLDIPLIYGTEGYPEGKAKIERFNSTITQDLLRGLRSADIDASCAALDARLEHYRSKRYNSRFNEGVGGIPDDLFTKDSVPLVFFPSDDELRRAFVIQEIRKVHRDNTVRIDGSNYEVPFGYTGRRIKIYRDVLESKISMLHKGQFITLMQADLGSNASEKRPVRRKKAPHRQRPIRTAANLHFERDNAPIVDKDGGFPITKEKDKNQ